MQFDEIIKLGVNESSFAIYYLVIPAYWMNSVFSTTTFNGWLDGSGGFFVVVVGSGWYQMELSHVLFTNLSCMRRLPPSCFRTHRGNSNLKVCPAQPGGTVEPVTAPCRRSAEMQQSL